MKKRKLRLDRLVAQAGRIVRFLFKSQLLTIFLALCAAGLWVGLQARPGPATIPYAELFDGMSVVSYRESPGDTAARFVVQLSAGGRIFRQYDVDAGTFLPPPRGRDYRRNITGTQYPPLRVRGHVATGFWLDPPAAAGRSLLPEQFDELYRSTVAFVKPVSLVSGVLGILSGYSVGYRIGSWSGSLYSRVVQERVLATPGLGRTLAREAWRRVLLEPVVMADESDAGRVAAQAGTHRLYAGFFRTALNDSDGFIPREAERLARAGRPDESRAMLAFTAAVRRAADDSVHLTSADFAAVERWAALLDRRGHWAIGSIPASGEERVRVLGTLAWYGLAPPAPEAGRVWVGPRLLVRESGSEGFVTDDIPSQSVGCPIGWRDRLRERHTGASAFLNAWLADRPEFVALAGITRRAAEGLGSARRRLEAWQLERSAQAHRRRLERVAAQSLRARAATLTASLPDPVEVVAIERRLHALGDEGRIVLLATDDATSDALSRAAQSALERADSLVAAAGRPETGERPAPRPVWDSALQDLGVTETGPDSASGRPGGRFAGVRMDIEDIAAGAALDAAADTLRALGIRRALLELAGGTVAIGEAPDPRPWRIAVADPLLRVDRAGWLRLQPDRGACAAQGVAAPGADSTTARPAAVVVIGPNALAARAWSTELLAMTLGEARRAARERADLSALLIETVPGGPDVVWIESDLRDRFRLDDPARGLFRVESY